MNHVTKCKCADTITFLECFFYLWDSLSAELLYK